MRPRPRPALRSTGYETSFNGQQHVNYLDADGHVHELMYKDRPGSKRPDRCHRCARSRTRHGHGRLPDHFQQPDACQLHGRQRSRTRALTRNSSWQHNDLTAGAGAPASRTRLRWRATRPPSTTSSTSTTSTLTATCTNSGTSPRTVLGNITTLPPSAGNPPPAAPGSALAGYQTSFNSQMHINYLDADGHVHELVYKHSPITVTPTSIIYNISVNLGADTGNIAGPVSLTLTSDGSYNFSGQLNDSGLLPYNVNVVVAIASDAGFLFLYTASQQIGANIPTVNNSWNWENTGNNGSIKAVWADLQAGIQYANAESNTLARDTIWNSMQSTFQGIKQIIQIIGSL